MASTAHVPAAPVPLPADLGSALTMTFVPVDWMDRAACNAVDPEAFFPHQHANANQARAVCAGCPVREQCLDYALDTGQRHGVWGGLSERERRRERGRRKRAATTRREAVA